MIRKFKPKDMDNVLQIWLDASITAHDFMTADFWKNNIDAMKNEYIPNSETWVIEDNECIVGFFSLYEDTLAALFIAPDKQNHGFGNTMMEKIKSLRNNISLTVYKSNVNAIRFYEKHGFRVIKEQIDKHTNEKEYLMQYNCNS